MKSEVNNCPWKDNQIEMHCFVFLTQDQTTHLNFLGGNDECGSTQKSSIPGVCRESKAKEEDVRWLQVGSGSLETGLGYVTESWMSLGISLHPHESLSR